MPCSPRRIVSPSIFDGFCVDDSDHRHIVWRYKSDLGIVCGAQGQGLVYSQRFAVRDAAPTSMTA